MGAPWGGEERAAPLPAPRDSPFDMLSWPHASSEIKACLHRMATERGLAGPQLPTCAQPARSGERPWSRHGPCVAWLWEGVVGPGDTFLPSWNQKIACFTGKLPSSLPGCVPSRTNSGGFLFAPLSSPARSAVILDGRRVVGMCSVSVCMTARVCVRVCIVCVSVYDGCCVRAQQEARSVRPRRCSASPPEGEGSRGVERRGPIPCAGRRRRKPRLLMEAPTASCFPGAGLGPAGVCPLPRRWPCLWRPRALGGG